MLARCVVLNIVEYFVVYDPWLMKCAMIPKHTPMRVTPIAIPYAVQRIEAE